MCNVGVICDDDDIDNVFHHRDADHNGGQYVVPGYM